MEGTSPFFPKPLLAETEARKLQILLLWNDCSANRIVKFSVEYSIEGDLLNVFDVVPIEVKLLDLRWGTVVTQMAVRSSKTYELVRSRFLATDGLKSLVDKIAERHHLSVINR